MNKHETNNINNAISSNSTANNLSYQNNKVTQWLCELLAGNQKNAFLIEKNIISGVILDELDAEELKTYLVQETKNILTKEEYSYYSTYDNWEMNNFMQTIKNKIDKKNTYDMLGEDVHFKGYTTTYLLAQKMCFELGIRNKDHDKFPILLSYIQATKPNNISLNEWIELDETFFMEIKKVEKAKNPITFIDLEHSETLWEEMIHVQMFLYLLISRKSGKQTPLFYSMENNDIRTFSLRDEGLVLFERVFNAGCGLYRELMNDPNQEQILYSFKSINDIQRLLLGVYRKPGMQPLPIIEHENLEGYIDVVQCLFHIGSHKLRGKSGKKQDDQFVQLVEKKDTKNEQNAWQTLFDLQPFWNEVVSKFSEQLDGFNLFIDSKRTKPLNKEYFENAIDKKTLSWSITTYDTDGNEFLFTGRCKQLDKIVNKMLNSSKYNHIDAFNDILGTRFELIKATNGTTNENTLYSLFEGYMDKKGDEGPKFYNFKGKYTKYKELVKDKSRGKKHKQTTNTNGIDNTKTGMGYSEIKIVFNGYEVQFSEKGNNTSGNKDDSIYGFKKIIGLLRRIKKTVPFEEINIQSMQRWIYNQVKAKRYDHIKNTIEPLVASESIKDSKIIEDMCIVLLAHEIMLEELELEGARISGTILYEYAKLTLPITKHRTPDYFATFEKNRSDEQGRFSLTFDQLKNDQTPIAKDIYNCITQASQIHEVYRSLELVKDFNKEVITNTLKKLDDGLYEQSDEDKIAKIIKDRIASEKIKQEHKINSIYENIGGGNYKSKVKKMIEQLEIGLDGENLAKRIFWEALLDKKYTEVKNTLWNSSKKFIKLIGHGLINKLNGILNQSGTYISAYPELSELLEEWKMLNKIENSESFIELYRQGKNDFFLHKKTIYAEVYQITYNFITKHTLYHQYNQLIDLFVGNIIENEIAKSGEWSSLSNNNKIVNKINSAKIARIQKMYERIYGLEE